MLVPQQPHASSLSGGNANSGGLWPTEESLREEILQRHLNPDDYDLKVHLSGILDSDEPIEKDVDIALARLLARQNTVKKGNS